MWDGLPRPSFVFSDGLEGRPTPGPLVEGLARYYNTGVEEEI